jgi:hypothetical protein
VRRLRIVDANVSRQRLAAASAARSCCSYGCARRRRRAVGCVRPVKRSLPRFGTRLTDAASRCRHVWTMGSWRLGRSSSSVVVNRTNSINGPGSRARSPSFPPRSSREPSACIGCGTRRRCSDYTNASRLPTTRPDARPEVPRPSSRSSYYRQSFGALPRRRSAEWVATPPARRWRFS